MSGSVHSERPESRLPYPQVGRYGKHLPVFRVNGDFETEFGDDPIVEQGEFAGNGRVHLECDFLELTP